MVLKTNEDRIYIVFTEHVLTIGLNATLLTFMFRKRHLLWKQQNKFLANLLTTNAVQSILGMYAFFHRTPESVLQFLHDALLLEKLLTLSLMILERLIAITCPTKYERVSTVQVIVTLVISWIVAVALRLASGVAFTTRQNNTVVIGVSVIALPLFQAVTYITHFIKIKCCKNKCRTAPTTTTTATTTTTTSTTATSTTTAAAATGATTTRAKTKPSKMALRRIANYAAYSMVSNISFTYTLIILTSALLYLPSFIVHLSYLLHPNQHTNYAHAFRAVELVAHMNGILEPIILVTCRSDIKKELTKHRETTRLKIYRRTTMRRMTRKYKATVKNHRATMKRYHPQETDFPLPRIDFDGL